MIPATTKPKKVPKVGSKKKPQQDAMDIETEKKVKIIDTCPFPTLKVEEDSLTVSGFKGYQTISANYRIIEGTYYFEVKVESPILSQPFPDVPPQVRVGIATKTFDKETSLGSDPFSYAYKGEDGCIINDGIPVKYGEKYQAGDVIGVLLHMKPPKPSHLYTNKDPNTPDINEGSKLLFFKNGICEKIAFTDLHEGFYYASASLYMNARVKFNFGPDFEKSPNLQPFQDDPDIMNFNPYSIIPTLPKMYDQIDFQ